MSSRSAHRLALVTGCLKLGGSTTFLVNLAGELVRRQIPVEVISLERDNPLAADFEAQRIPVLCLDDRRLIFEDRMTQALRRLAEFKPTVVVTTLGAASFEVLRYLPSGIFRIGMGQSDDPGVYRMMAKYASFMDLAAMVSQAMKQKAASMPEFARVPVEYLSHGVSICPDEEVPMRDFSGPLQILYIGRLEREQKRVHLFPRIFEQLKASGIPFHWTIVGDGSARKDLQTAMKADNTRQSVSFLGQVIYAGVAALNKRHDVCLLASDYEGFGLSVAESMGYGVVPVVSDLPAGIPEMVDATTGVLVPVNDVAGYARAIIFLHEHRDELAVKSVAARARIKTKFSIAAMANGWLAALPPVRVTPAIWPADWQIKAPLTISHPFHFSKPIRMLRRIAKRLSN